MSSLKGRAAEVIYLEPRELEVLTGYKRPANQRRWLDRHGIPYIKNARGFPVVRRDMDKTTVSKPAYGPVP